MKITKDERKSLSNVEDKEFPKYTKGILNNALNFSQANRPKVVGSMNEFRSEFEANNEDFSIEDWRKFYFEQKNGEKRLQEATEKTQVMIEKFKKAIEKINEEMIREYIEDLVIDKTFVGFNIQAVILKKLEKDKAISFSFSNAEDESKGIDAYINGNPVSIKPKTYRRKNLNEQIEVPIIFYEENENTDTLDVDISELEEAGIL